MSSRSAAPNRPAAAAALPIVERLTRTVTAENRGHRRRPAGAVRALWPAQEPGPARAQPPSAGVRQGGRRRGPLREALAELNAASSKSTSRALAVQLKAATAVAEIIARAIREGQSDGTYTARAWRGSEE